jgi:hypothetical protein
MHIIYNQCTWISVKLITHKSIQTLIYIFVHLYYLEIIVGMYVKLM